MKKGEFATFEIIDGLGIKTFEDCEICDFAFLSQIEAYKLGYATKIIKRINEKQILMDVAETEWIMQNLEGGKYYDNVFVHMAKVLEPILIKRRKHKTVKQKKHILDFARHNLGIYNNKIVMLDFS